MSVVWYQVRDLDAARSFYRERLGFTETLFEADAWSRLERNGSEIGLTVGEPVEDGPVAHIEVDDVKAEADRLRAEGVDVGVVLELHGEMRLLGIVDPDGNRIELGQDVSQ